jgi:glycosyltransferase involved in cell wall biosynthesis
LKAPPPIVLIVPTYNEEAAIGAALAHVPRALIERIIVADGGSRDGTARAATAAGAEVLAAGRGYGRACWLGALAAPEDALLVFMDGDGSDRAECLAQLVSPIIDGTHDFVIASRVRGTREPGSMGWHQVLIGLVIGALIRLRFGFRYTDMCAFRAIRRDRLLALGMQEMTYGWNLEMQMKALRHGLRVLEVPVPYGRRRGGVSKVSGNLLGTIRASGRLLWTFLRLAR